MTINRLVRTIAGLFIFLSVVLGAPASPLYHSSYWLWFTVFIGVNLFLFIVQNKTIGFP